MNETPIPARADAPEPPKCRDRPFRKEQGFVPNERETIALLRQFHPGQCPLCWLYQDDAEFLAIKRGQRRGPYACWKRRGISADCAYRHRRYHLGRSKRSCYFTFEELARRRAAAARLAPWYWKPGQSGGGNRRGCPDRRRRLQPCGQAETIRLRRAEAAVRQQRALAEAPGQVPIFL
jgi:hypothetical protein